MPSIILQGHDTLWADLGEGKTTSEYRMIEIRRLMALTQVMVAKEWDIPVNEVAITVTQVSPR